MDFGLLRIVGGIGAVFAQGAYLMVFARIPRRISISWGLTLSTIASFALFSALDLSAAGRWAIAAYTIVAPTLSVLVTMPIIVYAADIANAYTHPTLAYAVATSLMNICGIASTDIGGLITHAYQRTASIDMDMLMGLASIEEAVSIVPIALIYLV